jgi:hypothetical protein
MEETMRVQTISKLTRLPRIELADLAARIIAALAAPIHSSGGRRGGRNGLFNGNAERAGSENIGADGRT